jgi:hypothetical protein
MKIKVIYKKSEQSHYKWGKRIYFEKIGNVLMSEKVISW